VGTWDYVIIIWGVGKCCSRAFFEAPFEEDETATAFREGCRRRGDNRREENPYRGREGVNGNNKNGYARMYFSEAPFGKKLKS